MSASLSKRAVEFQRLRRRAHRRIACVVCVCVVVLLVFYTAIAAAQHAVHRHAHFFVDRIRHDIDRGTEEAAAVILLKDRDTGLLIDEVTRILDPAGTAPPSREQQKGGTAYPTTRVDPSLARLLRIRKKRGVAAMESVDRGTSMMCGVKKSSESNGDDDDVFPSDLFSLEQRQKGAIVLHFAGLIYMFIALAIVCDEYFVPALGVLTERLAISDDVAGATFMAAGGSAPEFFTSVFGVFITQNNVGIGTIVGSATFNILCVLAFCTLFSKQVLQLTWWPLFRDMSFYIIALFLLVIFFSDERVAWHEALAMLLIYVIYGIFMKYNVQLEHWVKRGLLRKKALNTVTSVTSSTTTNPVGSNGTQKIPTVSGVHYKSEHRRSIPVLHAGTMFRSGIVHMALDEHDGHDTPHRHNRQQQLNGVPQNLGAAETFHPSGSSVEPVKHRVHVRPLLKQTSFPQRPDSPLASVRACTSRAGLNETPGVNGLPAMQENAPIRALEAQTLAKTNGNANGHSKTHHAPQRDLTVPSLGSTNSEPEKPVDISWPSSPYAQILYIMLIPIVFPLYFSLPDVKKPSARRFVVLTFIGSILWIAFYSYLMVWWANTIGETLVIPNEIMGLTVLAAGTSIPDLITSVIVARKGLGDMAVSSSIGSNMFDICVGLPVPWLIHFIVQVFKSSTPTHFISVSSNGLLCSVGMLFAMLIVLVISIAITKWRMNKYFGVFMILAYIAFCIFSVLLETGHIVCPLRPVGLQC
ncbi:hypothetical protein L596_028154 [Steinernema carpocapsae]|uniref:Sodium/calcium exchanger membrane region domain-containing protein n=1 Tax=Steinernema carpocapsae TaxID=34508 RepID=A0A4U5LXL6_STECR|nr:hypothetical protein L596_028154 [Steinernema carpocapsae]